jgi:SAM-dependent methyltransferase
MGKFEKNNLKEAYNKFAEIRDQFPIEPWKAEERDSFLSLLKDERKSSLLEIGSGTGRDSLYFKDNGLSIVCIDLSEEMINICRSKGLDARTMDFYRLDFPDDKFDAVYALNCLLHVPKAHLGKVLLEIRRVLKSDVLFFLGVYGGKDSEGVWEQDSYNPKRFFSMYLDEHIINTVKLFFEVIDFHVVPLKPDTPHFQSLTLRKPLGESS